MTTNVNFARLVPRVMQMVVIAGWVCLALTATVHAQTTAAVKSAEGLPPAERFFRPPDVGGAALSPSGRWLAIESRSATSDRNTLIVLDLRQAGAGQLVARFEDADIRSFQWVNDDRLIFDVHNSDVGAFKDYAPGLFSVRRDGSALRALIRVDDDFIREDTRLAGRDALNPYHRLIHVPGNGGDEVIVAESIFDGKGDHAASIPKWLNVTNGRTRTVVTSAAPVATGWWFDALGEPRVATASRGGRALTWWRGPGERDWVQIGDQPSLDVDWWPLFVDNTGQLWVSGTDGSNDEAVLSRFDFAKSKPESVAVVRTPGFSFDGGVVAESVGGRALGVRVTTDAETTVWYDARLKTLQGEIDRQLPGRINRLTCRRCDHPDMTVLVRSSSDRDPGQYWLYRADSKTLDPISKVRKDIDPATMATKDFVRIKTRDGLDMPVWITLPARYKKGQPRAAVVLVHGGPFVRGGYWHWDGEAQFLASRGYVVIEPEFRGSTGFGGKWFRAGWKQLGLAMQDDVADALGWAVSAGYVDARRACIAGYSYGGYSALMGLARHPDLYRCGVASVALTDIDLLYLAGWRSDLSEEARTYALPTLFGDRVKDQAKLRETSPVHLADQINAPVMLAFGALDRRIPIEHGQRMRAALRAAGKDPDWVVYDDEGHGWSRTVNRIDYALRLERFLATHLR